MKQELFNSNFNNKNFIDYMCLIFEDKNFSASELEPYVKLGFRKGFKKYKSNKRESDFIVYVSYFVKTEVEKYKNSKLLINISFRKK